MELAVFDPGMTDDDDISPSDMHIPGQDHQTVSDRLHGVSQSLLAPSIGDPVLAQMTSRTKTT